MSTIVIVGSQWGDEGKGKITDFLAEKAHVIARYQGGNNAGHTIKFDGKTYKLQLMPSGIFNEDKLSVIGNGLVVDPKWLCGEIANLQSTGVSCKGLRISNRAHVVLPYHIKLDEVEEARRGENKIGTTKKGIGPTYVDKYKRCGIRIADLLDEELFRKKLEQNLLEKNEVFEKIYGVEGYTVDEIFDEYFEYGKKLSEYVTDTAKVLDDAQKENKNILFEGAQGVMLDIDHGTYPYVTSSNPSAGGITVGNGFLPTKGFKVLGICKAYTSRVGDGPFPTELFNEIGERIREIGNEYGTVTRRPRRIGWFDTVVMRHSSRVSGMTNLSVNCLDVLSGLDELKICTAYDYKGELLTEYPASENIIKDCIPVYETLPGFSEDITGVTTFEELPINAQNYLRRIEELVGVKISVFSTGPDRTQTHLLEDLWN
ncbi:adenylosuccinate synthase [Gemelliphila palaticanis]|uniref:Adenylosuccinate synthetase n=1 Tax=Gemelliphila palaticanis TaxID=81950 RepID=A0ABX2T0I1_9BACL|nr:adenylosuccinate synthase [Gemella palaticanis]MBF0714775.1 adenylosuccinate synthase [Gemella palaticanis]NYS46705.1 adenylosuccinate synthase [Gemella palaticanis]